MAKNGQLKAEAEKVRQYEDRLDNILFECMEIMKRPEKWAMDRQGNFITVYPHPIVNREANSLKVKYLPHKSYNLPEVLLERLIYWEYLTAPKVRITPTTESSTERKVYVKPTPAMVAEMLRLKDTGYSNAEVARQVGVSEPTARKYTRLYQEQIEAVAN
jgi:hypothetical protein